MNFQATDAILPTSPPAAKPKRRHPVLKFLAGLSLLLALLMLDLAPSLPKPTAPSPEQVEIARGTVNGLRTVLRAGNGNATIRMSRAELASGAALASWVGSFGRFDVSTARDSLQLRASRQVIGPVWINAEAFAAPSRKGMPPVRLRIGRLALTETESGWLIGAVARVLRWRGVHVPPLDDMMRSLAIEPSAVMAQVHFPLDSGLVNDISGLRLKPVDPKLTARIYCRLVAFDTRWPNTDMAVVVNRAFQKFDSSADPVELNRSAFVALAMYTADPAAGRLAGGAEAMVASCLKPHSTPLLLGRDDLPKHWSLSAALTVALGDDVGKAMGEWKELADSRPNGSGFSFVDLAADRAGLAAGRAASDPARAEAMGDRLRKANADQLLPVRALAMSEGLPEAAFVSKYGTIDSARFADAVARIDKVIAKTVGE